MTLWNDDMQEAYEDGYETAWRDARDERNRYRALLRWVYEQHGADWAMVCDEECEIARVATGKWV